MKVYISSEHTRCRDACLDLSFRDIEQTVEIILGNWGRGANGNGAEVRMEINQVY
jgi:hypothetical protein